MGEFQTWHNQTIGTNLVAALEKNNFQATYVATKEEAVEKILAEIPREAEVGIAGSWTIAELDLAEKLKSRGTTVHTHNNVPGLSQEESTAIRHKELNSDVFLCSTNAITLSGELINVDGLGNRVASMIYGPKKVILVVGINKIALDVAAGIERTKLYACPINNKRLKLPNPCTVSGQCMDCQGPSRICNVTTIIHKRPTGTEMHIYIVGEDLGF